MQQTKFLQHWHLEFKERKAFKLRLWASITQSVDQLVNWLVGWSVSCQHKIGKEVPCLDGLSVFNTKLTLEYDLNSENLNMDDLLILRESQFYSVNDNSSCVFSGDEPTWSVCHIFCKHDPFPSCVFSCESSCELVGKTCFHTLYKNKVSHCNGLNLHGFPDASHHNIFYHN